MKGVMREIVEERNSSVDALYRQMTGNGKLLEGELLTFLAVIRCL